MRCDVVHRAAADAFLRGQNDQAIYYWLIMSLYALK